MVSRFPDVMSSGHGSMGDHDDYERLKAQWDLYECEDVVGGSDVVHCRGMYQNFPNKYFNCFYYSYSLNLYM